MVIISFDNIERKYFKLLETCNRIHTRIEDYNVREELLDLTSYISNMPPKLTLMGLFQLNCYALPTFVSTVVAYFMVILQFKSILSTKTE